MKKQPLQKDSEKVDETYKGDSRAEKAPTPIACYCQLTCATEVEQQRIFNEFYKFGKHATENKYL